MGKLPAGDPSYRQDANNGVGIGLWQGSLQGSPPARGELGDFSRERSRSPASYLLVFMAYRRKYRLCFEAMQPPPNSEAMLVTAVIRRSPPVKLRCGKCRRVFDEVVGVQRDFHVPTFGRSHRNWRTVRPLRPLDGERLLFSFGCSPRCGAKYVVHSEKIVEAYFRAIDRGEREILLGAGL